MVRTYSEAVMPLALVKQMQYESALLRRFLLAHCSPIAYQLLTITEEEHQAFIRHSTAAQASLKQACW